MSEKNVFLCVKFNIFYMFKVHLYFLFFEFYDHILCPFLDTILCLNCCSLYNTYICIHIYIHKPVFFYSMFIYGKFALSLSIFFLCHFVCCLFVGFLFCFTYGIFCLAEFFDFYVFKFTHFLMALDFMS